MSSSLVLNIDLFWVLVLSSDLAACLFPFFWSCFGGGGRGFAVYELFGWVNNKFALSLVKDRHSRGMLVGLFGVVVVESLCC